MDKVRYIHNETIHNTRAAEEILPYVFSLIHPDYVLDIGCGTGSWLKVAKDLNIKKITGVDGIYVDKNMLCIDDNEFVQHDLTQPLTLHQQYDLALCLEVAEHLPENAADNLIDILIGHADIILFSAAIPGQGGQNHINEQWPQYWERKFAARGFLVSDCLRGVFWGNSRVEWWYRQNMLVYFKNTVDTPFTQSKQALSLVHPDLLAYKTAQIDQLKNQIHEEIMQPKFRTALKRLLKSIVQ